VIGEEAGGLGSAVGVGAAVVLGAAGVLAAVAGTPSLLLLVAPQADTTIATATTSTADDRLIHPDTGTTSFRRLWP
jgi:hypothetical protein